MRASEALKILESLDPSHEVTLTIGRAKHKVSEPVVPVSTYPAWHSSQPMWLETKEFWPSDNKITCKMH